MIRIFLLFSVATFLLSGCIDLLQQTKTKDDDLQSVKKQVEELRGERADRNVTIDDLRVRVQLVAGEIDSTRYSTDQKLADLDTRFRSIEERLGKIEDQFNALDATQRGSKEVSAEDLWEDGQKYYNSQKYTDAILKYEELKTRFPGYKDLPRVYLQQARAFAKIGKTKEAKLFYNKVRELYPKSREAKEAESEIKALK
ncbi:MAG: hypothetical protein A3F16_05450 [Deltaproteobacteria bacterium RIFCSPHIGHO2_12_FULL_43_9]|nr:MAG: hypothetical protein A3F16_05450 [Deltaproteobacteria bacterium RIFCSPHIGHO2_12_FULL_43_9]